MISTSLSTRRLKLHECARCHVAYSDPTRLTREHHIPEWFIKRSHMFGLDLDATFHFSSWRNIRQECHDCNSAKGFDFDYADPYTREFFEHFIDKIREKLDSTSYPPKSVGQIIQR